VSVYPNPANGSLTITHAPNSKISIVNLLGQQVYEKTVSGTQTTLNTRDIKAKGVVYINIVSGSASTVKKVMINE
jgi:Secretion system C-terminal sorting domain